VLNMNFKAEWDLSTIPEDNLRTEWARRNSLRRTRFAGGRPEAMRQCLFCSARLNGVQMRAHRAACRQDSLSALHQNRTIISIVPTFDDPHLAGFFLLAVSRETIRLEKCNSGNHVDVPTRAIRNIIPGPDGLHATIGVAGRVAFSREQKRWTFTPEQAAWSPARSSFQQAIMG
jgi:hypothetical protein